MDGVLQFLNIEINGKAWNCNWKKSIYQNLYWMSRNIFTKMCMPYNYKANNGEIWWKFAVPIFLYKIKWNKIKNLVNIKCVYYIFFEKCLDLACFNAPLMPVNMEARKRLLLDWCIQPQTRNIQTIQSQLVVYTLAEKINNFTWA